MRNFVIDTIELTTTPKPLAGSSCVATVTLIASTAAKDGSGITLSAGGKDADLPPGVPVRFEQVDISLLSATGKEGDTLAVLGHSAD